MGLLDKRRWTTPWGAGARLHWEVAAACPSQPVPPSRCGHGERTGVLLPVEPSTPPLANIVIARLPPRYSATSALCGRPRVVRRRPPRPPPGARCPRSRRRRHAGSCACRVAGARRGGPRLGRGARHAVAPLRPSAGLRPTTRPGTMKAARKGGLHRSRARCGRATGWRYRARRLSAPRPSGHGRPTARGRAGPRSRPLVAAGRQ